MRRGTFQALVLVAMLSLLAADMTIGCGQGYVYGVVEQKVVGPMGDQGADKEISINGRTYDVPPSFYNEVRVGDTVRFNGKNWAVVKRGDPQAPPP